MYMENGINKFLDQLKIMIETDELFQNVISNREYPKKRIKFIFPSNNDEIYNISFIKNNGSWIYNQQDKSYLNVKDLEEFYLNNNIVFKRNIVGGKYNGWILEITYNSWFNYKIVLHLRPKTMVDYYFKK